MEIHGIEFPDIEYRSGSKQWPSDDPADSPMDSYVCKKCGWLSSYQACGAFPLGYDWQRGVQAAIDRIIFHVERCTGRKK